MNIRRATTDDGEAVWRILEPTIRAAETYPLPADMTREAALAYWLAPDHDVFVADDGGRLVGTYYLRPNQRGGGAHVANCGYVTAPDARGRGVARAMCRHSLDHARARGFRGMQFNFVVSTNERAVRLWQDCGFAIVGRLPRVFHHPVHGDVDAFVMFQPLTRDGAAGDEQRLRDIVQGLARAWLRHDRAFIDRVLAAEWSVTQPDGQSLSRDTVLGPFFDTVHFERNEIDDVSVLLLGTTAVVRGRTVASATVGGAAVSARIRFTDVFVTRDGRWQVVASHASTLAP